MTGGVGELSKRLAGSQLVSCETGITFDVLYIDIYNCIICIYMQGPAFVNLFQSETIGKYRLIPSISESIISAFTYEVQNSHCKSGQSYDMEA